MPWLRPMVIVSLCSKARRLSAASSSVHVGQQDVGGAHQLHVEAGVEHVRRGHALVHEPRIRADDFGQVGQEGDDVVLGFALDLVDAGDVELGRAAFSQIGLGGALSGITPSSARASQACASISNQMRNLVSGDQMATMSGRE
jgi:hypothetical protein